MLLKQDTQLLLMILLSCVKVGEAKTRYDYEAVSEETMKSIKKQLRHCGKRGNHQRKVLWKHTKKSVITSKGNLFQRKRITGKCG